MKTSIKNLTPEQCNRIDTAIQDFWHLHKLIVIHCPGGVDLEACFEMAVDWRVRKRLFCIYGDLGIDSDTLGKAFQYAMSKDHSVICISNIRRDDLPEVLKMVRAVYWRNVNNLYSSFFLSVDSEEFSITNYSAEEIEKIEFKFRQL